MKTSSAATLLILAVSAGPLFAQPYSLDENGDGTLGSPLIGGPFPMPFEVAPDPTGGITNSPVLIYSLDSLVVSGDLALMNSDGTVADLLRFFTPAGTEQSVVIFYSRADETDHALADVGIPYSANPVEISEETPTTIWYPTFTNQPGCPVGAIPVFDIFKYNIITTLPPPVSLSGTNLIVTVNGSANLQFCVVATTNISLPNWTPVSTNTIDQFGHCAVTLPIEPDKPQRFYRVAIPTP